MLTAASILHAVFSLLFVIGLILLTAYVFRRWQENGRTIPVLGRALRLNARTNQTPALEILETRPVDFKRKLVLVRRGDVAHLLLCGEGRDIVIETGIPFPPTPHADDTTSPRLPDDTAQ